MQTKKVSLPDFHKKCVPWDRFSQEEVNYLEEILGNIVGMANTFNTVVKPDKGEGHLTFVYTSKEKLNYSMNFPFESPGDLLGFIEFLVKTFESRLRDETCKICETHTTQEERDELEGKKEAMEQMEEIYGGKANSIVPMLANLLQKGIITNMEEAIGVFKFLSSQHAEVIELNSENIQKFVGVINV